MQLTRGFQLFFALVVIVNIAVWFYARPLQAKWGNVPPAPGEAGLLASGLGDQQLAYRLTGMMLQNLGNIGGRAEAFKNYDYAELEDWFFATYDLDPRPSYIPFLAAFYFGASNEPAQAAHVVNFLEVAGNDPQGQRWRWLLHAVFLAKHKMDDPARAQEVADVLAELEGPKMPVWTKHMNVLIRNQRGESDDAYRMMVSLLQSSAGEMSPQEVRFIVDYICNDILTPEQVPTDPVCQNRAAGS